MMHLNQMGAIENGALLSASKLEKHGYFVNSPSSSDDVPLKHSSALDDEAPEQIYGSDGEELMSETEYGRELVRFMSTSVV